MTAFKEYFTAENAMIILMGLLGALFGLFMFVHVLANMN